MKPYRPLLAALAIMIVFSSCSLFKPKYGCPTNGRNAGAEKLIDGTEGSKKAPKFRG